jgi:homoserine dehydrogenase
MAERAMRVGLVGLGTIGTGVVRTFQAHGARISERLGFPLELAHIADIDLERDRGVELGGYRLSRDWREIVDDPSIDLVVELVGGTRVARELVLAALEAGKHVVTANKALLAQHGREIYALAASKGAEIAFEASVGGTIPVLRALREGLCADRVQALHGIVNGTCNFILTEMEANGEPYEACLKRAQDLGYAEADPSADIDGSDSANKLAILVGLAFGAYLSPTAFPIEGIRRIVPADIEYANRIGFRIKLLAVAKRNGQGIEARVHPTMIPRRSVLAGVEGSMNAIEVHGELSGPTLYYGAGAGALPTASAVVADLMELARARRLGLSGRVPPLGTPQPREAELCAPGDQRGEFYVRFTALD